MVCTTTLKFFPIPKLLTQNDSCRKIALVVIRMHLFPSVPDPAIASVKIKKIIVQCYISLHFLNWRFNHDWIIAGQKYGMLEIKVVLANLMRRFRFSVSDPSAPLIVPSSEVVLKPKHGIPLILSKRSFGEWSISWLCIHLGVSASSRDSVVRLFSTKSKSRFSSFYWFLSVSL